MQSIVCISDLSLVPVGSTAVRGTFNLPKEMNWFVSVDSVEDADSFIEEKSLFFKENFIENGGSWVFVSSESRSTEFHHYLTIRYYIETECLAVDFGDMNQILSHLADIEGSVMFTKDANDPSRILIQFEDNFD